MLNTEVNKASLELSTKKVKTAQKITEVEERPSSIAAFTEQYSTTLPNAKFSSAWIVKLLSDAGIAIADVRLIVDYITNLVNLGASRAHVIQILVNEIVNINNTETSFVKVQLENTIAFAYIKIIDNSSFRSMTPDIVSKSIQAAIFDAANNNNTVASQSIQNINTLAPTVTLSSSVASIEAGQTAIITATFSEEPRGFSVSNFVSTVGDFSGFTSIDSAHYSVVFTPTAGSSAIDSAITIAAGSYTDAAGNLGGAGTAPTLVMDMLAPSIVITDDTAGVGTSPVTYTFTLSEPSSTFSVADITVTGGTAATSFASGISGDSVYSLLVTPTANSTTAMTVDVAANTFKDAAGNINTAAIQSAQGINTLAPTVTLSSSVAVIKAGQTAIITATFSEVPSGFSVSDFVSAVGDFNGFTSINSTHYSVVFTPTAGSSATDSAITIAAGSYTNAAGNLGGAGTAPTLTMDMLAPSIVITDDTAGVASAPVTYTFTLSEPSSTFIVADITVTGGTAATSFATGTSGDSVYTLLVTPTANSTTAMTVDVTANTFKDAAGNINTAAIQSV